MSTTCQDIVPGNLRGQRSPHYLQRSIKHPPGLGKIFPARDSGGETLGAYFGREDMRTSSVGLNHSFSGSTFILNFQTSCVLSS